MPVVLLLSACVGVDPVDTATPDLTDSVVTPFETGDSGPEQLGGVDLPPVMINELVAHNTGSVLPDDGMPADWLELYNPTDSAVVLGGYHLSDDWRAPERFALDDAVVIEAGGYLIFWADGDTAAGTDHTNFVLSDNGGAVGLFGPDGESMDWVLHPALGDDVAYARLPDGSENWDQIASGTPGETNRDLVRESVIVLEAGSNWAYHDKGIDLGTSWREPDYDDSAWPRGVGAFGYGDSQPTELDYGSDSNDKRPTAYFRTTFAVADPTGITSVVLGVRRDDGAAVYLNGVEAVRTALPEGELTYDTLANTTAGGEDETSYFAYEIDPTLILTGDNALAVEVHQVAATSSDMSFDLTVELESVYERE
jgi:hypothetical protein